MDRPPPRIDPRRLAGLALALGAVALVVATGPGLGEVRERLAGAGAGWLALAGLAQVGSCLAFVVVFRGVLAPRLGWRLSGRIAFAAQGTNVLLPSGGAGGLALAGWALGRTGMDGDRIVRGTVALFLVTSAMNFGVAVVAGTLLAAGLVAGDVGFLVAAVPAVAATVTIVLVAALPRLLRRDGAPGRGGRVRRLLGAARGGLVEGVEETGRLLASPRPAVLAGSAGYMLLDVAALAAAFAAVGGVPPLGVLLLAYVLGQLGGLVPLPGGIGGTDGGLVAALVLYGTPLASAAAAVLLYRVFQLGLPALLGSVALSGLPAAVARPAAASRPGSGSSRASEAPLVCAMR